MAAKRQQGYIIRLAMFVPVDTNDMDDVMAKAKLVKGLQDGTALGGTVPETFAVRMTSREAFETAIGDPAQTDIEEAIDGRDEEGNELPEAGANSTPAADAEAGDAAVPAFLKGKQARQKAPV